MSNREQSFPFNRRFVSRMVLLAVVLVQSVTHLFWLPISAHSGQVAIPWMLNEGRTLFGDVMEQHAPASSLLAMGAQRLFMFAEPLVVARWMNVGVILAISLLVYLLAAHLRAGDERAGMAAVLVWAWWAPVYGNVAFYFDTLLSFAVLLAVVTWVKLDGTSLERSFPRLPFAAAGLLMGAATLAKQHAWLAVVMFGVWLWVYRDRKHLLVYGASALAAPLLMVAAFTIQGNLGNYIYWNWTYNLSGFMPSVFPDGGFFRKVMLTNILIPGFVLLSVRSRRDGTIRVEELWVLVGLMWLATAATLYPRAGEIHVMGHLPFVAVMSGVVLGTLWVNVSTRPWWAWPRETTSVDTVLVGLLVALALGWLWTGAAAYVPSALGPGVAPGHDEFIELSDNLQRVARRSDTLFILPQTDSTPQIHSMSGILPPGTWVKGWAWYFDATRVDLLTEWETRPPRLVVVFPDLLRVGEPGITPLVEFVEDRYTVIAEIPTVTFHGPALIYRLR